MGRTSGASTTDAVIGHPTPTISGFAPVTSFGDGHRVMNAGASPSAPGLAGKYKYFELVLEYTSTSTKYYMSVTEAILTAASWSGSRQSPA